jgi:hypothetical protein
MAISTNPIPINPETSIGEVVKLFRDALQDLEDQLNNRAQIYVSTDGKIPTGLNTNDILVVDYRGTVSLLIKKPGGFDRLTAAMIGGLTANSTNFLGVISQTGAPALSDFPNPSDWGFYRKTNAVTAMYLCFNYANTLFKVALT